MTIPQPKDYRDGLAYMRDMHKLVLHNCAELETLLKDAEQRGVFASFAAHPEWEEQFTFFTKVTSHHERDEERYLFPLVASKIPRIGFQQPNSPLRFLIEGHEVMQDRIIALVKQWQKFRESKPSAEAIATNAPEHRADDAAFIAGARELVSLYRDHVAMEEQRVYSLAATVLTPSDKMDLLDHLLDEYDNEAVTNPLHFDMPQYTDPSLSIHYVRSRPGASRPSMDADYEDEPR